MTFLGVIFSIATTRKIYNFLELFAFSSVNLKKNSQKRKNYQIFKNKQLKKTLHSI
jgi:hypothetical protein